MSTASLLEPVVRSNIPTISDDEPYEVIDGNHVRLPPMGILAVWLASDLHSYLSVYARTHNIGRAICEALFHLPNPINRDRRPDMAFVSFERWPKHRALPPQGNAWDVVPNLATEVVSPTDSAEELQQKIGEYFQAGVQLVWVVYPAQCTIHVYHSLTQISVLSKGDTLDGGTVVPGFQLPLTELFSETHE